LGDDATLTFTGTASPTATYTWTIGNETLTGVGPQNVTFNTNGMVNVVLSVTENGCTDTISHAIMVSSVGVSLVAANTSVLLGEATTLTATATSVPPSNITYTWSPSGLSCVDAVCSGVLVTPAQNTLYSVTATNEYGCVASDEVTVSVVVRNAIIIPNAFSPNEDGTNDIFLPFITSGTPKTFALFVYDRWGNRVYETTDIANGWDGTYKGFNCEVGVYVYYVAVTYMDNTDEIIKGNVTLVK
jgi:gliding motility-associated-like protein